MRFAETWFSPGRHFLAMHLLYLDDAGSPSNPAEKHFILAGIAVFERQAHWLQTGLDGLAETLGRGDPSHVEFHGNTMLAGRGRWRGVRLSQRRALILQGLQAARALRLPRVRCALARNAP